MMCTHLRLVDREETVEDAEAVTQTGHIRTGINHKTEETWQGCRACGFDARVDTTKEYP